MLCLYGGTVPSCTEGGQNNNDGGDKIIMMRGGDLAYRKSVCIYL